MSRIDNPPTRNPRVALLGGLGFVGTNVRDKLRNQGLEVEVFSRATGCDLLDMEKASAILKEFSPGYIVNCAAMVGGVHMVTKMAADVVDANMRIILNLYQIVREISSALVINPIANCAYPGEIDLYLEERLWDEPIHPSVLGYGGTRRMLTVVSDCYSTQYGLRTFNLLVPNMYGPHDSTDPNKAHALNAMVCKFVKATMTNQPDVEVWGTGKPIREWLFAPDFGTMVRSIILAALSGSPLEHLEQNFNIGQKRGYTVRAIAEMISEMVDYRGEIQYNTAYGDGAPKKVMDDTRLKEYFPDFRFTDLRDGLAATVAYYRSVLGVPDTISHRA